MESMIAAMVSMSKGAAGVCRSRSTFFVDTTLRTDYPPVMYRGVGLRERCWAIISEWGE